MQRHRLIVLLAVLTCSIVGVLPTAHAEEETLDVKLMLRAQFVSLEGAPAYIARGAGTVSYSMSGGAAVVRSATIPDLTFEAEEAPNGMEALTVIIRGSPQQQPIVCWDGFPRITMEDLALHIRAWDLPKESIDGETPPLFELTIQDISLTTEEIEVSGHVDRGYVDTEKLEAQLVGTLELPFHTYTPYAEHLAGQEVILEFVVQLTNPFSN